jgi:hypothetical protein
MMAVALAGVLAACGGSPAAPSTSTPVSVSGTWVGSGSDSSASLGAGSMMGQAGLGAMTWQLTQSGSTVTGSLGFSSMQGRMPGTLSGTMADGQLSFTFDMPMDEDDMHGMMSSVCAAHVAGTVHIDTATMTMTGTYDGSNTCFGAFTNGQVSLTHQ